MIVAERLTQLASITLKSGSHSSIEQGACTMELVSWVAGEPFSDAPSCACPVITAFAVSWNDSLPADADRDRLLKPLIPLIIGTRSTPEVEQRRATMAACSHCNADCPSPQACGRAERLSDGVPGTFNGDTK